MITRFCENIAAVALGFTLAALLFGWPLAGRVWLYRAWVAIGIVIAAFLVWRSQKQ